MTEQRPLGIAQHRPQHDHFRARHAEDQDCRFTIALAGQPNVGKSTLFNMLTGLNQHVGNWPGKTVEQKIGYLDHGDTTIRLVDLPGTYSLTCNSEEERITRDFIIRERPDVVVAIVNAAALERNLYLVAELLSLPSPVVIGLNMLDVAEQEGIRVEWQVLQAAICLPVVPIVATQNRGLLELVNAALGAAAQRDIYAPNRPAIREDHRPVLDDLRALVAGRLPPIYPEEWIALKLLEGDGEIAALLQRESPEAWERVRPLLLRHEDAYLDIAGGRYDWIGRMVRAAVIQPKHGVIALTDRLDRIATHPGWGLALLAAILGLIFWLTYALALPVVDLLQSGIAAPMIESARTMLSSGPAWLSGLIADGILGGAAAVLTFLPILAVFFAALGLLEDTGYLARAAYVMDRYMHWMGLHGRSFLPLCLAFGCNVPGMMGARILDDRPSRLLTILLAPLIPCTGRMAVVAFLAPVFFGQHAILVTIGLTLGNLAVLAALGVMIRRVVLGNLVSPFILEMPLYHRPNARTIGLYVWHNTRAFVKKAATIIMLLSVLVWALTMLPDGAVANSWLAGFGRWLEPAGRFIGLGDWRLIVALLTSFVAKESAVATLSILYHPSASTEVAGWVGALGAAVTPAAALAFLVVQMLFIPCVATLAVMRQETGQWKWPVLSVALQLVLSLLVGGIVFRVATALQGVGS